MSNYYNQNNHRPAALTDAEELLIQPLFDYLDHDRDGQLTIKQAVKLWSLLGFAPAKAEFKNHLISLDDFLLVLNNKKSTGQLGRDDVDGRVRRVFQMMDPRITTRRMGFEQFRSFLRSLDIKAEDDAVRNIFDVLCAQTAFLPKVEGSESEGFSGEDLSSYITAVLARTSKRPQPLESVGGGSSVTDSSTSS